MPGVIKSFGMSVCDNSDRIDMTEKVHNLSLSGLFQGNEHVLVKAQIGFNQEHGCVIRVAARSKNAIVSQKVLECVN